MTISDSDSLKVNDKRLFNADGSERLSSAEEEAAALKAAEELEKDAKKFAQSAESFEYPPVNFSNFILSLASSVQMSLGMAPNPFTGKAEKDLAHAKHSLDLMGMLQEKTKSNLSKEEEQLLQVVLTDLRMRFVEVKNNEKTIL